MEISVDARKAKIAHCFVPEILVNYLTHMVRNGNEKIEPASFFIIGVCLLVDISGFTKMSEQFCDDGKGGIDSLQVATNEYMGTLVDVIYSHGGDIIKFAGDALVCVFANPDMNEVTKQRKFFPGQESEVPVETVLQAVRCAHHIRHVRKDKLSVHVAMSCGEMCFGILGGVENRWECLISGPCIHQLSDCLDDAPSTQAVLSPECQQVLIKHAIKLNTETPVADKDGTSKGSFNFGMVDALEVEGSTKDAETWKLRTDGISYSISLLRMPSGNLRIISVECDGAMPANTDAPAAELMTSPRVPLTSDADKAIVEELIRQFVPLPIIEELDNALGLSHFAEIREVTTMFMKVSHCL